MSQGLLQFKYDEEVAGAGMTALAGLPTYLELAKALGLVEALAAEVKVRENKQGWTDAQIVMSLILLQLAGGDCVEDLRVLEGDEGFSRVLRQAEAEMSGLPRAERRRMVNRWRREQKRAVPSPSSVFRFLNECAVDVSGREFGKSWIPPLNAALKGLRQANHVLVEGIWARDPLEEITLDLDATVKAVSKKSALFSYKHCQAYQPLNLYCPELDVVVDSEFRDGNVWAGTNNLGLLIENLAQLPEGVKKVRFRSDSAGDQVDLILYLANGLNERFGAIEFTISIDVSPEFRKAVATVPEEQWKKVYRFVKRSGGKLEKVETGHEYAEVCYTSNKLSHGKKNADLRFIAIRQLLEPDEASRLLEKKVQQLELPFQTVECPRGTYKLHGLVSNRLTMDGNELVLWHWERCGKAEEAHAIMKDDLGGGRVPSGHFGGNAAWWATMVLAFNLNSAMRHLVLGKAWANARLKTIRFNLIRIAGRVVEHARQLRIRVSKWHPKLPRLLDMRQRIAALAQ